MTDIFRSRVGTNVVPLDRPNPNASRSGLGEGLQALGDGIGRAGAIREAASEDIAASQHRIAMEEQRRRRSALAADRAAAWAEEEATIEAELDEVRRSSKPGAVGHQVEAQRIIDDRVDQFRRTLGDDPEVLERFMPMIARQRAQLRLREERWELAKRAEHSGASLLKYRDLTGQRVMADPTPQSLQAAIDGVDAMLDLQDIDGTTRETLRGELTGGFVRNYLDGLIAAGGDQAVKAQIDSGALDAHLDPQARKGYLRQVEVAEGQRAIQAEQEASRAREAARDSARNMKARIDAGVVPGASELREVRGQMQAAGVDEHELTDFDAMTTAVEVNRRFADVDDGALRATRDGLLAKQRAGRASDSEQMTLAQLNKLVEARDEEAAKGLRDTAASGPQGQLQALAAIDAQGGGFEQQRARADKAQAGLGVLLGLGPQYRRYAVDGRAVRGARKSEFGTDKEAREAMATMLGPVAATLGGDHDDFLEAAMDVMAGRLNAVGRTGFDQRLFAEGVNSLLGARRRGDGQLAGGVARIRGKPVLVPPWMTGREFDTFVARMPFDKAIYLNGSKAAKADIVANYAPTFVGEDDSGRAIYEMRNADGQALRHEGGGPYVLRLRPAGGQ